MGGMSHLGLDEAVQSGECLGDLEELRRPSAVAAPEHREVGSDEGRLVAEGTQEVELALPLEPGKVAQVGLAPRTSVSGRPERRTPAASVAARHRRLGQTKVHLQPPKLRPKGYDEHICVSVLSSSVHITLAELQGNLGVEVQRADSVRQRAGAS